MDDLRKHLLTLRHDFAKEKLDEKSVFNEPLRQFEKWLKEAIEAQVPEPNAMILSTVDNELMPSSRVVLLRSFNEKGFVFFTNYNSRKGKEIRNNPKASLLFFWPHLERQIRIEGLISKIDSDASNQYFHSRPLESRLGAWASNQSEKLNSRIELENKYEHYKTTFQQQIPSRPPYWGGYILKPEYYEFWQGRESRLHDRICYEKQKLNWEIGRLSP